jgi:hypothetical protein
MKKKDLNACLARLQLWQDEEALDQGQKEALRRVTKRLRKLFRHANPDPGDVLNVVREVTETLWKAFVEK